MVIDDLRLRRSALESFCASEYERIGRMADVALGEIRSAGLEGPKEGGGEAIP